MSTHEQENGQPVESKSSVRIEVDSKGQIKPTVKVYEGTAEAEMQRLVELAAQSFKDAGLKAAS